MKKKTILIFYLVINASLLYGQTTLINEGTVVNSTVSGDWGGVNIPRSVATNFTYRNNSITSVNSSGYMLQAGDESPLSTNNKLDGEVITGNKLTWNGVNGPAIITHGLFAGYNINSIVKYNYLENVPYGIIFKSGTDAGQNMTFTSGGCAYNITKNGKFAGRVKGINGVKFYNNTFYSGDGGGWYLLLITANMDRVVPASSTGTKVFNNIFYSTIQIPMIKIESGCLTNFESDYNVYWCTAGEPTFNIDGATISWAQWKARGYDSHSVIINPDFINTTDLVPRARLDYGKDLGTEWQSGLSTTAAWIVGSSPATANQNGAWQVGARIYEAGLVNPSYTGSVVENATPTILDMTYSLSLANIVPAATAFSIQVNAVARTVNSVAIVGGKVRLTLASPVVFGNTITVTYTKPAVNPLQTAAGGKVSSFVSQPVVNNCMAPPPVYTSSVVENATPSLLEMTYSLSLANIIPAGSSFNVLVNSVARSVTSVMISGNKVQLTLASAIKFGDVITVSYTKPSTNGLQSTAGGVAASISTQSTINKLINQLKDVTSVTIKMNISPNQVHKIINIILEYSGYTPSQAPLISPQIIRITDLSGKLFIEKLLETGVTSIKIPLNLRSGIYIVRIMAKGLEMAQQKIVVY